MRIYPLLGLASFALVSCAPSQVALSQNAAVQKPPANKVVATVNAAGYKWDNVAIGGGGFVTGLVIHPREKDLLYIRTDIGGCYRWNPKDKEWIPLMESIGFDDSNLYGVDGLAIDPSNPDVVYVAAGKYDYATPADVLKSTDRGRTWQRTGLNKAFGGNQGERWAGERIVVDPRNSRIVVAGTSKEGLWMSSDGAATWRALSLPEETKGKRINTVLFDPNTARGGASQTLYAGVRDAGLYVSEDGGATWKRAEVNLKTPYRMAIGINKKVYVTGDNGLYEYSGNQWKDISPEKGKLYNAITTHPTDANILMTSQYWGGFGNPIFRSEDGGATWKKVLENINHNHSVPWAPRSHFGAAISSVTIDPHDPKRVWFTDWYATWINPDISKNDWYTFQKGHEEIVAFDLKSMPQGAPLLSGVADVSGLRHTNLDEFPAKGFGTYQDTIAVDAAESDPNFVVRIGGRRGGASYSTDNGQTWTEFAQKPGEGGRVAVSADGKRIVWLPWKSEPFVSTDRGATWQKSTGAPANVISGVWDWRQPLTADRVNPNRFYIYLNGNIFVSEDGGLTWKQTATLAQNNPFKIKAAPGMEGEVWAALDKSGLHRSSDGGKSFTALADVQRAYLMAFGKPAAGRKNPTVFVYGRVAGQNGIFRSDDVGAKWIRINDDTQQVGNSPNSMEGDRQVFGRVYIGTNGRGIYYGEPAK